MKIHGMYQQDDRDLRDERRRQKLEPAYRFMIRVRLPGGVCTPEQWLKLDELARAHGGEHAAPHHPPDLPVPLGAEGGRARRPSRACTKPCSTPIAACGDVSRNVMCAADPEDSALHAEVVAAAQEVSDEYLPKTRAYHEIWYGEEKVAASDEEEEPFYGATYLPRKFKIGFVVPPSNDIDVYTQDLGFIAIGGPDGLEGFNVAIGGGMGRTENEPATYPRLADVIGYIPKDRLVAATGAVMSVQRDYGNRAERNRARFKYTIDDKGLDWIKARDRGAPRRSARAGEAVPLHLQRRRVRLARDRERPLQLHPLRRERPPRQPARPRLARRAAGDRPGASRHVPGHAEPESDRRRASRPRTGRRSRRCSPSMASPARRQSAIRRNSIACVALPTCGLAMAEAERYLPDILTRIEALLAAHGLADEPITFRISGCPNGCSRPYVAEIALTGRAPGKYNLYLGGGFHGERLARMVRENVGEAEILSVLEDLLGRYAARAASRASGSAISSSESPTWRASSKSRGASSPII